MRLTFVVFGLLALHCAQTLPLVAQEQEIPCKSVPAVLSDAVKAAYPKAVVKSCAKETDKDEVAYEFSTDEGKVHRDILYSETGKLIVVEETIPFERVPAAVKSALKKKHPKGKVALSEKLTGDGVVKYEFSVKSGGKTVEIVFDEQGKEVEP
jgi:Putative beta-lactamase-inhibitor-like, PepSY-like